MTLIAILLNSTAVDTTVWNASMGKLSILMKMAVIRPVLLIIVLFVMQVIINSARSAMKDFSLSPTRSVSNVPLTTAKPAKKLSSASNAWLDTSLPQINASAYQSLARKASFSPATNASAPLEPFKHLSNVKHALNPIANLVAPPSVSDAMILFTFQLISSARNVCPTANYAILATLAIFASMGTCTIPTLHNASAHLPKAAPS